MRTVVNNSSSFFCKTSFLKRQSRRWSAHKATWLQDGDQYLPCNEDIACREYVKKGRFDTGGVFVWRHHSMTRSIQRFWLNPRTKMAQIEADASVGLLNLMKHKISKEAAEHTKNKSENMEETSGHEAQSEAEAKEDEKDETVTRLVTSFSQFFNEEWEAFKTERATRWSEKKTENIELDFKGLRQEWKYDRGNREHWINQAQKQKETDTCCPLFYSILVGIVFVVIPNGAILLDMLAASDYLGGQWYLKRWNDLNLTAIVSCIDPLETPVGAQCCRVNSGKTLECFEKDPLWGTLTLIFLFIPGVFWSLGIFIQFASYLRTKNPEKFNQKRILFFFFLPAAALCTISFPLQLMIVSIIATFNTQVS